MANPARPNSWIVASWREPFGIPSLSFMVGSGQPSGLPPSETGARSSVADVAVAESLDLHQQRVIVAIDEQLDDLQSVSRGLSLRPQLVAGAAEEGREAALTRARER